MRSGFCCGGGVAELVFLFRMIAQQAVNLHACVANADAFDSRQFAAGGQAASIEYALADDVWAVGSLTNNLSWGAGDLRL